MKLAIGIGYGEPRYQVPIALIRRAEELGFDSVWASETYGTDAFLPLAFIAAHTTRLKLGTSIAHVDARTPASTAMAAMTLDALAGGGRTLLGLGVSGPQIVEGWYGRPWGKPNLRLRDTVAILRKIFRREGPVTHDGQEISLPYTGPGSVGLGKPLKSILAANPELPIYLGTDTDLNVRMTAEIADGWIPQHFSPDAMKHYRPILQEGFARRTDGKTLDDFDIRAHCQVKINADVRTALDEAKPALALSVGGMGARSLNFHKMAMIRRGYPEAAERVQELFLAGRKDEAAAAVPDDFVDDESLIGPPERIKQRMARWRDSGATILALRRPNEEAVELVGKLARQVF